LEDHLKAKMPRRNNKIITSNSGGIEKACWKHFELDTELDRKSFFLGKMRH